MPGHMTWYTVEKADSDKAGRYPPFLVQHGMDWLKKSWEIPTIPGILWKGLTQSWEKLGDTHHSWYSHSDSYVGHVSRNNISGESQHTKKTSY